MNTCSNVSICFCDSYNLGISREHSFTKQVRSIWITFPGSQMLLGPVWNRAVRSRPIRPGDSATTSWRKLTRGLCAVNIKMDVKPRGTGHLKGSA